MEVYSIIFQTSVNELSLLKSLIVDLESSNWYQIEALDQINTQMFGNFGFIHKQKSEKCRNAVSNCPNAKIAQNRPRNLQLVSNQWSWRADFENFKNFGISHKQSPKNCENVLYDHPLLKTLKSLKIGLETSNWYQIKALGELISKVASNLGPFIKEVRKFMDSPSKFEEIGDSLFDIY